MEGHWLREYFPSGPRHSNMGKERQWRRYAADDNFVTVEDSVDQITTQMPGTSTIEASTTLPHSATCRVCCTIR
ncbi:MAG: hypothetical protein RL347_1927 [Actinomycetota bacterium]